MLKQVFPKADIATITKHLDLIIIAPPISGCPFIRCYFKCKPALVLNAYIPGIDPQSLFWHHGMICTKAANSFVPKIKICLLDGVLYDPQR